MKYSVDLDERQYAMLCGDAILLSTRVRHEVWSARPVAGRWLLRASETDAVEMRDVFRIRGMVDAVATIERALAMPRDRGSRRQRSAERCAPNGLPSRVEPAPPAANRY